MLAANLIDRLYSPRRFLTTVTEHMNPGALLVIASPYTWLEEFTKKGRGTQGVIGIQCSERNGALVSAVQVTEAHELMLISNQGTLVRTRASEISQVGRNTQGVTLIRLPEDERLVGLERLDALPEEEGERPEGGDAPEAPVTP